MAHPDAIITLDVGGKIFKTYKSILVKGSKYFEDIYADISKDDNEIIFIDDDPLVFERIMMILRAKAINKIIPFSESEVKLYNLIDRCKFYQIKYVFCSDVVDNLSIVLKKFWRDDTLKKNNFQSGSCIPGFIVNLVLVIKLHSSLDYSTISQCLDQGKFNLTINTVNITNPLKKAEDKNIYKFSPTTKKIEQVIQNALLADFGSLYYTLNLNNEQLMRINNVPIIRSMKDNMPSISLKAVLQVDSDHSLLKEVNIKNFATLHVFYKKFIDET